MTPTRRTVVMTVMLALLTAVGAMPALAHGGDVTYTGQVGPFYVEARDWVLESGEGVLYTLMIREGNGGLPVDGADVSVTATFDGQRFGPRTATNFANQYQLAIPDDRAATIQVHVAIAADSRRATFSQQIAGSGDTGPAWWLPALRWGLAVLGPVVFAVAAFRRKAAR